MITLKFDSGEAGSDYGFFYADQNGEQETIGPSAPTQEEWEKLNYSEEDAIKELLASGFIDRSEIEIRG